MPKESLIVGLDIGSNKVAIAAAAINEQEVSILALTSVPHTGLRKGMITDVEETISAISHALEDAERMAGTTINRVYVSVNGGHIEATPAKGIVAISKPNGEIDSTDVARVIDAAKTSTLPQNREMLHLFPIRFWVDGQDVNRDPMGMNGIRLEVETLVISTSSPAMRNLTRAVTQSGLDINGFVFGPLANAKAVTTKKQREIGIIVADIGAGSTDLAVFEEGQLVHAASIPIGSMHLTNDIAIGLRTNLDVAENIKIKYGSTLPDKIRESEQINLASLDPAEDERISRKHVCEIIEARASEIFQLIKEELQRVGKDGILPGGIVFTGGGSELEGLTELAKEQLRIPAQLGYPVASFSGMVDKLDSPIYSTSIGLVLWGIEDSGTQPGNWRFDLGKFGGVFDKFRGIFKNFTN